MVNERPWISLPNNYYLAPESSFRLLFKSSCHKNYLDYNVAFFLAVDDDFTFTFQKKLVNFSCFCCFQVNICSTLFCNFLFSAHLHCSFAQFRPTWYFSGTSVETQYTTSPQIEKVLFAGSPSVDRGEHLLAGNSALKHS